MKNRDKEKGSAAACKRCSRSSRCKCRVAVDIFLLQVRHKETLSLRRTS